MTRPITRSIPALAAFIAILWLCACHSRPALPESYARTEEQPLIFPDYTDITCPYNIAPLNFQVMNPGKGCIAEVKDTRTLLAVEGRDKGKIRFDEDEWRQLLQSHKGKDLTVNLYVKDDKGWRLLRPFALHVAPEPIDSFLTYRLIEPGYIAFRRLGIYQRDLTGFEVHTLYENNAEYDDRRNHCINCHNFQQQGTGRFLLHVRANYAGTLIGDGATLSKVTFPTDSIPFGATYPAWHPTQPWVVFSSNYTRQSFHIRHDEKVEVQDMASDLIFYDHAKRTVRHILRTDSVLETFPHWAPDGKRLYYTAAKMPEMAGLTMDDREVYAVGHYQEFLYDLMYMDFDPSTGKFGTPHALTDYARQGKSASVVRVSPDGRFLLYTLADYGQFHIWHKSADLWVYDLKEQRHYALEEANSDDADSYHAWSSNGRWIAFSSRRNDGNFTRVFFSYFDKQGKARKAFMLPQADPEEDVLLLKSYNVPELTREPIHFTREDLTRAVTETQAEETDYQSTN